MSGEEIIDVQSIQRIADALESISESLKPTVRVKQAGDDRCPVIISKATEQEQVARCRKPKGHGGLHGWVFVRTQALIDAVASGQPQCTAMGGDRHLATQCALVAGHGGSHFYE